MDLFQKKTQSRTTNKYTNESVVPNFSSLNLEQAQKKHQTLERTFCWYYLSDSFSATRPEKHGDRKSGQLNCDTFRCAVSVSGRKCDPMVAQSNLCQNNWPASNVMCVCVYVFSRCTHCIKQNYGANRFTRTEQAHRESCSHYRLRARNEKKNSVEKNRQPTNLVNEFCKRLSLARLPASEFMSQTRRNTWKLN